MKTRYALTLVITAAVLATSTTITLPAQAQKRTTPRPTTRETPPTPREAPRPFDDPSGSVAPGITAPGFELDASNGRSVRLASLRGDWIILVFSDRVAPIPALRAIEYEMRTLCARVVAVCHEKAHTIRAAAQRDSVGFLILSDPTGQAADAYGFFDSGRSQTQPGFVIIDRRGIVRLALLGQMLPPVEIARLTRFTIEGA